MSKPTVISVENLGKVYRIGHQAESQHYVALRDVVADKIRGLFGRARQPGDTPSIEDFWALKDINFEIKQGEVTGIIGRNGAGKSTLLKILSRITDPTEGRVRVKGRVASLLEVGTGFHPELTGRENIYLNGAILGMSRSEIKRKFDEMVAFAEVEQFLDTPVKRYSSGMYVRLAFAVAAHLEPEILIVDEVLAVGDVEFQKKCLGKMQDVSTREGRTVLFVSHNMDAISRLCSSAIILNKGGKEFDGPTDQAVQKYLAKTARTEVPGTWIDLVSMPRSLTKVFYHSVAYSRNSDDPHSLPLSGHEVLFKLRISSDAQRTVSSMSVVIYSSSFQKLVNTESLLLEQPVLLKKGINEVHVKIRQLHLKPGRYPVCLWLMGADFSDWVESAFEIEIGTEDVRPRPNIPDGVVTCDFSISQPIST